MPDSHPVTSPCTGKSGVGAGKYARRAKADAARGPDVARGDQLLAPQLTRRLIERFTREQPARAPQDNPAVSQLTPRELDVLLSLAAGKSNAEIGAELFLSEATVKTHLTRVLDKLGVRDRVQAVVFAYETGLVRPGAQDG